MNKLFYLFCTLALVLSISPVHGQDKFHIHFDFNYLQGVHEKNYFGTVKSGLNGFDLNLAAMYDINSRLSAGVGMGAEKLYDPEYTIFPVFAKVMYSPIFSTEKPYISGKIGYGIGTGTSNSGLLFNPGIGYKIMFRRHFGLNFMLGYHLQSIRYDVNHYSEEGTIIHQEKENNTRHSISLGVGFIF